ncbi:MAG: threonine--tRNA ligase [bacterium]|nr:threonine--tRNA ligase [bacterium]
MSSQIENIRHSLAHLLAAAVRALYPGAKNAIGPAIENGFYQDFELPKPISQDDLPKIEAKMRELLPRWTKWTKKVVTLKDVKKEFGWNRYKLELAKEFARDKKTLTFYTCGGLIDLCKGGHALALSEIDPYSFKLDRVAGAYWRGDEKNKMLTRIYGLAFETKKELEEHLWREEEAKKRDHRILGERLKLFTFAKEVGPGLPLWLPNGTVIREEIEKYAKKIEAEWGYKGVATPHIAKEELYKTSGHIPYYRESMFPPMKLDDGNYYLKAMNCPHTHMIYKSEPRSYRDLPVRFAEYGTVYRYELSGTLAGLLRTRGFTQNDAHIYCREDQAEEEFLQVMKLHEFWYKKVFDIKDFYMRLALPAKNKNKFAGTPKEWASAITIVRNAMKRSGLPFVEAEGEAAFYGPKVDFQIKSVIGREETASTNQLDFFSPKRFGLTYRDRDGKEKFVYVIHRAPLGSHERFIAFLIEHYAGAFPFWLSPVQVAVLAINEKIADYAEKVFEELKKKDIRAELDLRNESISKKIREAELQKIPYLLIIGEKERSAKKIAVRERGGKDLGEMALEEFDKIIGAK